MKLIDVVKNMAFEEKLNSLIGQVLKTEEGVEQPYKIKTYNYSQSRIKITFSTHVLALVPEVEISVNVQTELKDAKEGFVLMVNAFINTLCLDENFKKLINVLNVQGIPFKKKLRFSPKSGLTLTVACNNEITEVGYSRTGEIDLAKTLEELNLDSSGVELWSSLNKIFIGDRELKTKKLKIEASLLDKNKRVTLAEVIEFTKLFLEVSPLYRISKRKKNFYKIIFGIILHNELIDSFDPKIVKIINFYKLGLGLSKNVIEMDEFTRNAVQTRIKNDFIFLMIQKDEIQDILKLISTNVTNECKEKYKDYIKAITVSLNNRFDAYRDKIEGAIQKYNLNCYVESIDFLTNTVGLKYNVKGSVNIKYKELDMANIKQGLVEILKEIKTKG